MLKEESPLWVFILETHVNSGADTFIIGNSLFEAEVSLDYRESYGPLGTTLMKQLMHKTQLRDLFSDWAIYWGRTLDNDFGDSLHKKKKIDWLEERENYVI